ncbi:MAG: hypothetical protein DRJ18_01670 [Candidatus Methanomethylicota archaeon]|nr:MAG: hypothetical protein DRJ18_01670 [Candidatus Verstraetearchaeota archaeon]
MIQLHLTKLEVKDAVIDLATILLGIGLALSFLTAISLGANDAATPTDCAVGAGVISVRNAVILFATFTGIGALLQGYQVMKTIGKGIVPEVELLGAITISLTAALWVLICSYKGLDVSVTYATIGSVVGYGIAAHGVENVNFGILQKVFLSWISSPLCSMALAYSIYTALKKILIKRKWTEGIQKVISWLLLISLCFSAYSFGANDVGNATGVYVTVAEKLGRVPDYTAMILLSAFGALGIAIGGLTWGRRVIETVAFRITRIDLVMGLAAEISNAIVVYLFTTIPYMIFGYGLPISTSLASNGSIIGVGLAKSYKSINTRTVIRLVITWIITVPTTALMCMAIFTILNQIIVIPL